MPAKSFRPHSGPFVLFRTLGDGPASHESGVVGGIQVIAIGRRHAEVAVIGHRGRMDA